MTKRDVGIVLFCVLISFAVARLVSTGGGGQSHAETAFDRVTRTGVLRCGYALSPPMLVRDPNTGAVSGVNVDVWKQIGSFLNLKVEWTEEVGWGNFIEGLRAGRYDAFCAAMFPDAGRAKYLSLTLPVMADPIWAYVRQDDHRFDEDIEKVNDPSVRLPVIDGDVSAQASATRFPKAQLVSLPQLSSIADMFLSVTTGKADIGLFDTAMFAALDQSYPGALRRLALTTPVLVFPMYYGFDKKEVMLRDSINVALQTMIDNGSLASIMARYPAAYRLPQFSYR